jgi:hypothetical protein
VDTLGLIEALFFDLGQLTYEFAERLELLKAVPCRRRRADTREGIRRFDQDQMPIMGA